MMSMTAILLLAACAAPSDAARGEPSVPATVTLGPVSACPSPRDAVSYTEVGEAVGFQPAPDPDAPHAEGGSVAVLDVDFDGDLDIVVVYQNHTPYLYRRDGGAFTVESVPGVRAPWLLGLTDLDADGLLDLLVGGQPPVVLLGDGVGFGVATDVPTLTGEDTRRNVAKVLAPGDLDQDGAMDLYAVVNAGGFEPTELDLADFVLWGDNSGGFPLAPERAPPASEGRGFDAQVFEWEGEPAIYVANDMGGQFGGDALFTTDGRTLVDQAEACACAVEHNAMGQDVGDWNGDGLADIYVAAVPFNTLMTAQPDGTFVDMALAVNAQGIKEQASFGMTWGAAFLDYDNDGEVDILDAQGDNWFQDQTDPWILPQPIWMLHQVDGAFVEAGEALGLDQLGSFRAVVAEDHNGDGVLDLLVTDVVERPQLYLSEGCTAEGWIEVAAPIDSRVEVTAGGRTWTAWTGTHSGYGGARAPVVHVGIGAEQMVERIMVTTTSGDVHTVEGPLEARRRVYVEGVPGVAIVAG
jgi:hypothetical protein